jgi:predicted MFS family arabinose efflux permease
MIEAMNGDPSTAVWSEAIQRKNCLLALIGMGIGQIVGAFVIGYVQDHFSNRVTCFFCLLLSSLTIIFGLIFIQTNRFNLNFAFALCFLWGL